MNYLNGFTDREQTVLLYRNATGQLMKRLEVAEYIAYLRVGDGPGVDELQLDPRIKSATLEGSWIRASYHAGEYDRAMIHPKTGRRGCWISFREQHCKQLEAMGVHTYEADVSPLKRLMADRDVQIAKPKRAYLDLETDSRVNFQDAKQGKARLLSWAVVAEDGAEFWDVLEEDDDEAERRLWGTLWDLLTVYDQIAAWNGDFFDFDVMRFRSQELGIKIDMRRWLLIDHLVCFKRQNVAAESGDEKTSMKLESIAQSLLGFGKHDLDASKSWEYWEAGGQSRDDLVKYNVQDTRLCMLIEEKTGYLELFQTLAETTGVFPDSRGLKPTQQVDSFMLRLGRTKDVHFPTKWYGDDTPVEKFKGAFVLHPTCTGIAKNVHVADMASYYPSAMITWNLSPEVKVRVHGPENTVRLAANEALSPLTGVVTRTDVQGILVYALVKLISLRKEWNDKRAALPPGTPEAKEAERRSVALKVAANSFYGVCGTPFSRFYDKDISESTTQNCAWLLKKTIEAAEQRGLEVVYGDSDSLFVRGCSETEFGQFVDNCNKNVFPQLLKEMGCKENKIKLAYEKEFDRVVFTAAKRYVGRYVHYKGTRATADSKPEIRGLEYKRGDTNRIARELQSQVIDMICDGNEDLQDYYDLLDRTKFNATMIQSELRDVQMSKSLSKPVSEYTTRKRKVSNKSAELCDGNDLAHVAVAKILAARGQEVGVGTRINYVVVDASVSPMKVIPAEDWTGQFDRHYVWENLVYPPTQRLLTAAFPKGDWTAFVHSRPSAKYNPAQIDLFGPALST